MNAWESHFRQKSRRRSRRRSRERALKAAVLLMFFGSLAGSAYLLIMGLPQ